MSDDTLRYTKHILAGLGPKPFTRMLEHLTALEARVWEARLGPPKAPRFPSVQQSVPAPDGWQRWMGW